MLRAVENRAERRKSRIMTAVECVITAGTGLLMCRSSGNELAEK